MALLTNINDLFTVDSTGAISFNRVGGSTTTGYTFPATDGTDGYVLKTNGDGVLDWAPDSNTDAVTKIIGGTNITVSPATGLGDVTVNADLAGTVTGSGTLNKVPRWTATGSNLGDGPITFATNDSTFAGKILSSSTTNGIELNQSTAGSATYYVMDNTVETGGKRYRFGYSGGSSDKGSFSIYNETDSLMPLLLSGSNSTFAGNITALDAEFTNEVTVNKTNATTPGKITIKGNSGPILQLKSEDTAMADNELIGAIEFYNSDGTANAGVRAKIESRTLVVGGTGNEGNLGFFTATASNVAAVRRLKITPSGGFSFGNTSTAYGTSGQVLTSNGNAPPSWQDNGNGTVTGTGAANRVTYWDSATNVTSDAGFTYNGTGRVSTDESFNVLKDGADTVADGPFFALKNAAATRQYLFQLDASNNIDYWYYNGTTWTQTISLLNNGGAIFTGNVRISKTDATLEINNSTGSLTNADLYISVEDTGQADVRQYGAYPLAFWTNNTERMRIEATGVVKFPNTATSTGDVGTIAHYTNNYMYMRGGTGGLAIGDDGFGVSIYLNNSNNIAFHTGAGTEVMQINNVGNVGIGVVPETGMVSYIKQLRIGEQSALQGHADGVGQDSATWVSTNYKFSTSGAQFINGTVAAPGYANIYQQQLGDHSFSCSATTGIAGGAITERTQMVIKQSGNVGIGTASPSVKLSINGWSYNPGAAANAGCVGLKQSNASSYGYVVEASANDKWMMMGHNGTNGIIETTYAATGGHSDLYIKTGGSNYIILQSSGGRVAIGSTVAQYGVLEIQTQSAVAYSPTVFTNGANIRLKSGGTPTTGTTTGISFGAGGACELYFGVEQQSSTLGHAVWQGYNGTAYVALMRLSHTGDLTVKGDLVAYGSPSDKKLKENIKPIKSALDKAMKLQGVTFDWKKSDSELNIKEDIGFIAQDVQKVVPELVRENEDGMLSMRHQGIAPILLEAIKELKAEIEELKFNKCNCNK